MAGNGDVSAIAMAAGLGEMEGTLAAILAAVRAETLEIAVSDAYGRELTLEHHPVTGCRRVLAHRTGNGFDSLSVGTAGQLVLPANEARIGLTITNATAAGGSNCLLYLSDAARKAVPVVFLPPGASWDGRFGNLDWAGNLWGVGQTGTVTLIGGEL